MKVLDKILLSIIASSFITIFLIFSSDAFGKKLSSGLQNKSPLDDHHFNTKNRELDSESDYDKMAIYNDDV